jgi:hypothetical protein
LVALICMLMFIASNWALSLSNFALSVEILAFSVSKFAVVSWSSSWLVS